MGANERYDYQPLIGALSDRALTPNDARTIDAPDRRDGLIYDWDRNLHLALEVALATGRPLLLRGEPGSGKSSFAPYVARNLGWRYYEYTVTSTTQAQDLLWQYDVVRRLADAQARAATPGAPPLNDLDYVTPGVLWWAFDAASALMRGGFEQGGTPSRGASDPNASVNEQRDQERSVILIDELDKADPEVPNALLVPLGSSRFHVSDIGIDVTWATPGADASESSAEAPESRMSRMLVVITTNEERQLPPAFLRRCVVHHLEHPDAARMVEIAQRHFAPAGGTLSAADLELCRTLATRVEELRTDAQERVQRPPSTAEYLDAVRACRTLRVKVGDNDLWRAIEHATLRKEDATVGER